MRTVAAAPWALECEGKGGRSSAPHIYVHMMERRPQIEGRCPLIADGPFYDTLYFCVHGSNGGPWGLGGGVSETEVHMGMELVEGVMGLWQVRYSYSYSYRKKQFWLFPSLLM